MQTETVVDRIDSDSTDAFRAAGRTVSRNAASSMGARVLYMGTRIFVPPFVLARVGLEAYGLWTTAFILVAYLGISTMGISNVYIKFVAEYNARKEFRKINELVSTGLMVTLPVCLILFALLVAFWPSAQAALHIPPKLEVDAKETILLVAAIFLSSIGMCAFADVLSGMQEIVISQKIWIVSFLLETLLIFVLVGMGRGIRGMAEAYFVRQMLSLGLSMIAVRKLLPWLRVSPRHWSSHSLRLIAGYGSVVQLQSVLSTFVSSVDRLVALPLVGVEAAGILDLAKKWPGSISGVPTAILSALLPAASHLKASDNAGSRNLQDLYLSSSKYLNLVFGFFCGFIVVMAGPILTIWLGKELPGLATLLIVFTISMQIHLLTGPGTSMMTGIGKPSESIYYSVANLLCLALFLPLGRGIAGGWSVVVIGGMVSLATAVSATYFILRTNSKLNVGNWDYLRSVATYGLLPYVFASPFLWPVRELLRFLNRWNGLAVLMCAGLLYTGLFGFVVYRYFLDSEAKDTAARMWQDYFGRRMSKFAAEKI